MHADLERGLCEADQGVGVGVSEKQCRLIEGEADHPNARATAEPRQDVFGHERLDEEDEKRRGESRAYEEPALESMTCGFRGEVRHRKDLSDSRLLSKKDHRRSARNPSIHLLTRGVNRVRR